MTISETVENNKPVDAENDTHRELAIDQDSDIKALIPLSDSTALSTPTDGNLTKKDKLDVNDEPYPVWGDSKNDVVNVIPSPDIDLPNIDDHPSASVNSTDRNTTDDDRFDANTEPAPHASGDIKVDDVEVDSNEDKKTMENQFDSQIPSNAIQNYELNESNQMRNEVKADAAKIDHTNTENDCAASSCPTGNDNSR
ncbi:hypothetical protein AGMMS49950_04820 [Endomicrobiia bacterium]|nr:hypothetical protein AGMMS49950_04820 [Endomicrobiia bacterium]